jgi:hypothetical protein
MRSRSRHSRRTPPTERSACARALGRFDHPNVFGAEDLVELTAELAVAVADQEQPTDIAILWVSNTRSRW